MGIGRAGRKKSRPHYDRTCGIRKKKNQPPLGTVSRREKREFGKAANGS
jgi:hypothetical protein